MIRRVGSFAATAHADYQLLRGSMCEVGCAYDGRVVRGAAACRRVLPPAARAFRSAARGRRA